MSKYKKKEFRKVDIRELDMNSESEDDKSTLLNRRTRRHHLPGLCCRLMYQGFVLLLLVAMVMALLVCGYIIYGMQKEISQLKNEVVDLRTDLKSVKQSSRNYSAMHESLSQFHKQLEQTHRYMMNISATQATSNEAFHIKVLHANLTDLLTKVGHLESQVVEIHKANVTSELNKQMNMILGVASEVGVVQERLGSIQNTSDWCVQQFHHVTRGRGEIMQSIYILNRTNQTLTKAVEDMKIWVLSNLTAASTTIEHLNGSLATLNDTVRSLRGSIVTMESDISTINGSCHCIANEPEQPPYREESTSTVKSIMHSRSVQTSRIVTLSPSRTVTLSPSRTVTPSPSRTVTLSPSVHFNDVKSSVAEPVTTSQSSSSTSPSPPHPASDRTSSSHVPQFVESTSSSSAELTENTPSLVQPTPLPSHTQSEAVHSLGDEFRTTSVVTPSNQGDKNHERTLALIRKLEEKFEEKTEKLSYEAFSQLDLGGVEASAKIFHLLDINKDRSLEYSELEKIKERLNKKLNI